MSRFCCFNTSSSAFTWLRGGQSRDSSALMPAGPTVYRAIWYNMPPKLEQQRQGQTRVSLNGVFTDVTYILPAPDLWLVDTNWGSNNPIQFWHQQPKIDADPTCQGMSRDIPQDCPHVRCQLQMKSPDPPFYLANYRSGSPWHPQIQFYLKRYKWITDQKRSIGKVWGGGCAELPHRLWVCCLPCARMCSPTQKLF